MQQTSFDYKKERSGLFLKYNIEMDETSSSLLFVIREEQASFFATQNIKLEEAIRKINGSNTSLQVDHNNPRPQAFWFGMGKWGLALIFAISIGSFFYMYHTHEETQIGKTAALLDWYREYYNVSQSGLKKNLADFLKNYPLPK